MRIAVVAATMCLSIVGLSNAQHVKAAMRIPTNIPAEDLGSALRAFAQARDVQILYFSGLVKNLRTAGASGKLTADETLTQLLSGTGLTYRYVDERAVTILPIAGGSAGDSGEKAGSPTTPTSESGKDDRKEAKKSSSDGLRMAQADQGAPSSGTSLDKKTTERDAKRSVQLEEIVVTGTHIPGVTPTSPLITVTREDIDSSGYSTIGDVIRSVPQSWMGGLNPNVIGAPGATNQQAVSGSESTVNLRGLGSESTLTLINGHRMAFSGFTNSVDISAIPLAAVERVELLTDGASAIYGSDAVAGVANFITRQDYDGADTAVRFGRATEGDPTSVQLSQLLGGAWTGGNAMISYEHTRQSELYSSDRPYTETAPRPLSLLPYQRNDSVFASARHNMVDQLFVYADGLYSQRDAQIVDSSAGFPGYNSVKTKSYGIAFGVEDHLGAKWFASLDANLSKGKNDQSFMFVSGGAILFSGKNVYDNRLKAIELKAAGPALEIPSGPVNLAVGVGYRKEEFQLTGEPLESRHLTYEYAELRVPLVPESDDRVGLERFEFAAAGRHEDYSDFGPTAKPQVGIVYAPIHDLAIRGSWSQSFRTPDLNTIFGTRSVFVYPPAFVGSNVPGSQFLFQSGANLDLKPETSTSWTIAMNYTPQAAPGLEISAAYFHIDYKNRITQPIAILGNALSDPAYMPFVIVNPTPALQSSVIGQATEFLSAAGPYDPAKVGAILNNSYQNAAAQTVHGFDLGIDRHWEVSYGRFGLSAKATWETLRQRLTPTSPIQTISGIIFNPPDFKGRLGGTWSKREWSASSFINYVGRETDTTNLNSVSVASWTTVDAQIRYDLSRLGRFSRGIVISGAVQNLLDRNPPRVNPNASRFSGVTYDSTNASPLGRFVTLGLDKAW